MESWVNDGSSLMAARRGGQLMAQTGHPEYQEGGSQYDMSTFLPQAAPKSSFMNRLVEFSQSEHGQNLGKMVNDHLSGQAQNSHRDISKVEHLGRDVGEMSLAMRGEKAAKVVLEGVKDAVIAGYDEFRGIHKRSGDLSNLYQDNAQSSFSGAVSHLDRQGQIDLVQPETWAKMATLDQGQIVRDTGYDPVVMGGGQSNVALQLALMNQQMSSMQMQMNEMQMQQKDHHEQNISLFSKQQSSSSPEMDLLKKHGPKVMDAMKKRFADSSAPTGTVAENEVSSMAESGLGTSMVTQGEQAATKTAEKGGLEAVESFATKQAPKVIEEGLEHLL